MFFRLSNNTQRPIEGSCREFLAQPTPMATPLRCPCSLGQAFFDFRFIPDSFVANLRCFRSRFIRNGVARRCCYQQRGLGFGSYVVGPRHFNAGYVVKYAQGAFDHSGHNFCCNRQTPVSLCVQFYNQYPSQPCRSSPRLSKSISYYLKNDSFTILMILSLSQL